MTQACKGSVGMFTVGMMCLVLGGCVGNQTQGLYIGVVNQDVIVESEEVNSMNQGTGGDLSINAEGSDPTSGIGGHALVDSNAIEMNTVVHIKRVGGTVTIKKRSIGSRNQLFSSSESEVKEGTTSIKSNLGSLESTLGEDGDLMIFNAEPLRDLRPGENPYTLEFNPRGVN